MSLDKIIVATGGVLSTAFVYWFFFMKKERAVMASNEVTITVDGGYSPEVIAIPQDEKTKIIFMRKDPNSCLEEIVLPDFKIRRHLPLDEKVTVEITPKKPGEFRFSCGMGMFHGKLVVK